MAEYEAKGKEEKEEAKRLKKAQPVYDQLKQFADTDESQEAEAVFRLQQTYGNRYVQRLAEGSKQATLDEDTIRRIEAQRGLGEPFEPEIRSEMETAFGYDFSKVRIHTDAEAEGLSQELGAKAFTTGNNIFFGKGQYSPASSSGKELISHELTHVVQQKKTKPDNLNALDLKGVTEPSDVAEQQAEANTSRMASQSEEVIQVTVPISTKIIARKKGAVVIEAPEEEIELTKGRPPGVFGNAPVGHASGWAFGLTPEMVLWQQGQYEEQSEIPYDAVRCGAAAILGAAIAGGPEALTRFVERLYLRVISSEAKESSLLPLSTQKNMIGTLFVKWNYDPGPGWNEPITNIHDQYPFTFDDLSWLQAIAYMQYVAQPGAGMAPADVQAAVGELAQVPAAPVAPGAYQVPNNLAALAGAIMHNAEEVYGRFIAPNAPARLQPDQSVLLSIMMFVREDSNWVIQRHAVTLSNIGGVFHIYNPETTTIASDVEPYLPAIHQGLERNELMGDHVAEAGGNVSNFFAVIQGIFGLTIGLVIEELTAPFRF